MAVYCVAQARHPCRISFHDRQIGPCESRARLAEPHHHGKLAQHRPLRVRRHRSRRRRAVSGDLLLSACRGGDSPRSGLRSVSKKERLTRRFPRAPFRGRNPDPTRPVLLSHKTVYHTLIYGSQKEDGSTQYGPGWKCGRNHNQVLGVCTGRRMAQPEADRWPLRLRAMPPRPPAAKTTEPSPCRLSQQSSWPLRTCAPTAGRGCWRNWRMRRQLLLKSWGL